jgi:hypothetical protein
MDANDRAFRMEEMRLRHEELARQQRSSRMNIAIAMLTVIFSAAAVTSGIFFTTRQARSNDAQFKRNVRDTVYNNIVTGLGSSAAAVQVNSMRLLVQYVTDRSNYDDGKRQQEGIVNAIQTLDAFIEDKSLETSNGLTNYESPQPIVLSRAMTQLKILDGDASLGSHSADVSRANLHGISLPYFAPQGAFLAVATDFRLATLHHLDLRKRQASLQGSFFTCSVLNSAHFGNANVDGADFSGADLRAADLAGVTGLTSEQLHGATTDAGTKLPAGAMVSGTSWVPGSRKCADVVDEMTGMLAGQGYFSRVPCPVPPEVWADSPTRRRFKGDMAILGAVCAARIAD